MSYKHGDWCCQPTSKEEAQEIIDRAVASGAYLLEDLSGYGWKHRKAWGVKGGNTKTADPKSFIFEKAAEYTIDEVRQKFPLPDDQVTKQWHGPEDGMPPVGTICTGIHTDVNHGRPCIVEILKHNEDGTGCAVFWVNTPNKKQRNLYWFYNFRPINTERDRWIEAAILHEADTVKDMLESIYDALQSGELKAPEIK